MKRLIFAVLVLSAALARAEGLASRPECMDSSSGLFFFPKGVLEAATEHADVDQLLREWFAQHLRAMVEPTLSCKDPGGEVYRFLWLRTFDFPMAVRIAKVKGVATLSAVELDGAGGYEPGKVSRRAHRTLTAEEWEQVARKIEAIDFWNMPGQDGRYGLDGARWVLEGRRGYSYHLVNRWSPDEGAYTDLCRSLLNLAGLPIRERR
jgi:hypothetical protein